jgi:hypothetical protein
MIIRNLVITVLVVELERIKDERTKDEQANKQPNKVKDAKKRKWSCIRDTYFRTSDPNSCW